MLNMNLYQEREILCIFSIFWCAEKGQGALCVCVWGRGGGAGKGTKTAGEGQFSKAGHGVPHFGTLLHVALLL